LNFIFSKILLNFRTLGLTPKVQFSIKPITQERAKGQEYQPNLGPTANWDGF
jgi:hypothetical protein